MKRIEAIVNELLKKFCVTEPPVPVQKIAKGLGLSIRHYDLGPGVSGALLLEGEKAVIGVSPSESRDRMRFTIAHETGHFCLHKTESGDSNLFVDKKVLFRDGSTSSGEIKIEREANAFAAELLMPKHLLENEIAILNQNGNSFDEEVIHKLAKLFKVSTVAMTYRLTNLGLLH